jgi:hypothetical protein
MFDNRYLSEKIKRENEGNPVMLKYMDGPLPEEVIQAQLESAGQSEQSSDKRGPKYEKLSEIKKKIKDSAKREKSKREELK